MKPHCSLDIICCIVREWHPLNCLLILCFVSSLAFSVVLTEVAEEGGASNAPLSFAEEIKLLTSLGKMEMNMFDSVNCRHVRAFCLTFACEEN